MAKRGRSDHSGTSRIRQLKESVSELRRVLRRAGYAVENGIPRLRVEIKGNNAGKSDSSPFASCALNRCHDSSASTVAGDSCHKSVRVRFVSPAPRGGGLRILCSQSNRG